MFVLLAFSVSAAALQPQPVGEELVLPAPADSCGHFGPSPAFAADGRLLVAWDRTAFSSESPFGLRLRTVGTDGELVGSETGIAGGGPATDVSLTAVADGSFVAAWSNNAAMSWQRIDAQGTPIGAAVTVSTKPPFLYPPAVAVGSNGEVAVAWVELNPHRLVLRRFGLDGTPRGSEETVDLLTNPGVQEHFAWPEVAIDSLGNVAVAYAHVDGGWIPVAARIRVYGSDGSPHGPARDVALGVWGPVIVGLPGGGFMVSWSTRGSNPGLWVQPLGVAGLPAGQPVLLSAINVQPQLALGPGWVAVAWVQAFSELFQYQAIRGRLLDFSGQPLGEEQELTRGLEDLFPEDTLYFASLELAASPRGELAVAWQLGRNVGFLPSGCEIGVTVMARRFQVGDPPLPPPPAPPGEWHEAPGVSGFRMQARLTPSPGQPVLGTLETDCVAGTACFSGALRGRTEVLVRLIGPRPNGRIWPTISRLTVSQVEVWIEKQGSGVVRYYLLPALPRDGSELSGIVDREGFLP